MLFPHNKRILSIDSISRSYLVPLIKDVCSEDFTGLMVVMSGDLALVLTFIKGEERSHLFWSLRRDVYHAFSEKENVLECLPLEVKVEVLEAYEDAVVMTEMFSRGRPIFSGPAVNAITPALVLAQNSGNCLLARRRNGVCELALLQKGEVTVGYRYEDISGEFIRVGDSFFDAEDDPEYWLDLVDGEMIHPELVLSMANDPLESTIEKFTAVVFIAETVLEGQIGGEAADLGRELLDALKEKYPPLYRGLYRNPETGQVNWGQLLKNRQRVNIKYRYDKFPLYLDEVLLKYIQILHQKTGVEGMGAFRFETERLKDACHDLDFEPVFQFFLKLDRMIGLQPGQF